MPDREKVVEELENLRETIRTATQYTFTSGGICAMNIKRIDNALALLKEQQEQIDRLLEESASNAEMAEGYAELLKEHEDIGTELTNAVELIHKKNERIEKLLKEQEVVKPKSKVRHGANAQTQHFCGNCNSMLHGKPKYCSECGKGVLW